VESNILGFVPDHELFLFQNQGVQFLSISLFHSAVDSCKGIRHNGNKQVEHDQGHEDGRKSEQPPLWGIIVIISEVSLHKEESVID